MNVKQFFDTYLDYIGESESPLVYHRWSAISMISAALGRNNWVPFGHSRIFPNMYIMLMGDPGARKSSAISVARKLLQRAEFRNIAVGRTSPEKFICDLEEAGTEQLGECSQIFIAADEFTDFIGEHNNSFISLLITLFDASDVYTHRLKNSKSISVDAPTVGILGGNTHANFARAFPPEIIHNGLLSRLLLVYGKKTKKRITWPKPGNESAGNAVVDLIKELRLFYTNVELTRTGEAHDAIDEIYQKYRDIEDSRFEHYNQRRLTQLLKLCTIFAGIEQAVSITYEHVLWANTLLHAIEYHFTEALGEFGKSKNSDVASKVMSILLKTETPMQPVELWKHVDTDCDSLADLTKIIISLVNSQKIMKVADGFLPRRKEYIHPVHANFNLLTPDERPFVLEGVKSAA